MSDLFGVIAASPAFADIRNQRPSTAEEKAVLLKRLGSLITRVPKSVANGSVQTVREWRHDIAAAKKIAGSSRASVHEITCAISSMNKWWPL